jgi:hypothetical protein
MTAKSKVSKDDVARLVRGKRSKNRVGSRQIRHRLRQDELDRLAIARERGYLLLTPTTRTALKNAWHLDCEAHERPFVCAERVAEGFLVTGFVSEQSREVVVPELAGVESFVKAFLSGQDQ